VVLVGDLNEADRKAAVAVAEQTDGVRQVVDRLQR
jgi:osmotically-inducible protein OsmY